MNESGVQYDFSVQIYDDLRASNWAYFTLQVYPESSPTGECLTLELPESSLTKRISTHFRYPLVSYLSITSYCPSLVMDEWSVRYTTDSDTNTKVRLQLLDDMKLNQGYAQPQTGALVYPLSSSPYTMIPPGSLKVSLSFNIDYNIKEASYFSASVGTSLVFLNQPI